MIAVDNHRNAGRMHWLIMPKVGPAARHIRDIEALTSDDLPIRMHCSKTTWLFFKRQPKMELTFRSREIQPGKRVSSKKALSECPSFFNPLGLSSWASTPYRTHHSAGHCVCPSYPPTCHHRAQGDFEAFQVSRLVTIDVDLR